ncbi:4893_t:CDS:2, partial [Scutellospora calospora]
IISLSNYGEAYNFSEYGNTTSVQQFSDEKLLLSTNTTNNANLLHLIYPNGSIVPINYEDSINFNNNSEWVFEVCLPLAENYILFSYYDRKEPLTDLSIHGTIINLQGKITTKDMVMFRHFNYSSSGWDEYIITNYDGFPQSFLVTYRNKNYLNWTNTLTQLYGSIRPLVDDFIFDSHLPFSTSDGQYAIVYMGVDKSSVYSKSSIYVHFINNGQDQTSEEHLLFQDSLDNSVAFVYLGACASGFDTFNIQSNGCTFVVYYIERFAANITSKRGKVTVVITFSSSGTVINRDVISTMIGCMHKSAFPLPYGGFISIDESLSSVSSQVNIYNFNYTSSYNLFEVSNETIVDYGIYSNNTLWLTYGNSTTGPGYKNRAILSTYLTLNMTIPLSYTDHFNITFSVPVVLSSGNISIYQVVDQDKFLLRQTYPASSYCKVYNISTLTCKTLFSTFNRVNNNYTIMAYNNFVKTLSFNEPLQGIGRGIWNVKTPQTYNLSVSSSTEVLLRLNPDGTKYFLSYDQTNKIQLSNNMLQQIKQSIPLNDDRLKITRNVQLDTLDSTKLLIEFSVDKTINPSKEPSVNDIINDLNDIIMNKHISALSDKDYMIFFDELYGFQPKPNLWLEVRYKLLILLIAIVILFVIYLLAKRRYPKGQSFIIFKISLMIMGLILDFSFIIVNGSDIPSLFIPSLIILIASISFNLSLSFIMFTKEIQSNIDFREWFFENVKIVAFCTLLFSTNVEALNVLSSNFFGLDFFSALVSENFKKWILYGTACHLFVKDIPQLVIQV